jgi:L-threonylcarbamoyladenylate synthase
MPYVDFDQFTRTIGQGQALGTFPTDTVPGLAAQPVAAGLIYQAKQRSLDKPLILLAAEVGQLEPYLQGSATEWVQWRSLMQTHWPGALTLVLPASPQVPLAVNPNSPGTIGVRIPNHPLARAILRETGALATTSANRSGEPAILDIDQIVQTFPEVLALSDQALVDLGIDKSLMVASGLPSTVAKWTTDHWQILRQGSVILPEDLLQP